MSEPISNEPQLRAGEKTASTPAPARPAGVDLSGLNERQARIARTLDEPLFVEAGAGSGKTFTLTQRVAWALSPGSGADGRPFLDDLSQVLVITFTEAAAREIRERVRSTLRRAGMAEAALAVDDAWIMTINGMCSRILHRYALDLGLDPDFSVVVNSDEEALFAQAMEDVMSEARRDEAFASVWERQDLGTYSPQGGHTGAMGQVRAILDAARALPGGLVSLVPEVPRVGLAELMHDLTMRLEELGAERLTAAAAAAVGPSLEALRAFDALAPGAKTAEAARQALAAVALPRSSKAIAEKLACAKAALALARAELSFADAATATPLLLELARRVSARYAALKAQASCLDNDDLVRMALSAVRDNSSVSAAFRGRFRLVMVDEFQDTDEVQLELIGLLSGEGARHLCTVGDAQQSIYRFRGADVGVFRRQGKAVGEAHGVRLDTNYRSHGDVLAFVERVGTGGARGGEPTRGTMRGFMHLDDNPARKDGLVARDLPRIDVEVTAGNGASGRASTQQSATAAAQVADALATYAAHGERPGDMALLLGVTTHAGTYIDAIRARGLECVVTGGSTFTSSVEARVACALLHALANPADTQSGTFPLLASEMFGLDANDFADLGTRAQDKLDAPTKRPIERGLATLDLYGGATPSARLERAHEVMCRALEDVRSRPVADVCEDVVRGSGWLERLEGEGAQGLARAANVLAALRYVRDLTDSLGLGAARAATEFDLWLAASKIAPASLSGADASGGGCVRVMTIHASKGLEFPVTAVAECWGNPRSESQVAVVPHADGTGGLVLRPADCPKLDGIDADEAAEDLADGRALPLAAAYLACRRRDEDEGLEEKARLLYVAMTRAREALVLSVAAASGKQGVSSQLAAQALCGLGLPAGSDQAAGVTSLEYGGTAPARVRTVVVSTSGGRGKPKEVAAESAGTLAGFDGPLPLEGEAIVRLGLADGAQSGRGPAPVAAPGEKPAGAPAPFDLYEDPGELLLRQVSPWSSRDDVFSYSSVAAAERAAQGRPDPVPTREQREAADAGAPVTQDADRATNLGSAFHELAQAMVERGGAVGEAEVCARADYWNLSPRARTRLTAALARWEGSRLRAEALSHGLVRAEVPFFCRVDSPHGRYLEGAIDLLATDPGSDEALLVDYKTGDAGLSVEQVRARHQMQAEFYADVLARQGFSSVTCAFVCVEREDPADPAQPLQVRYHFGA